MTVITRASAKSYFVTAAKPTQSQFADTLDSVLFQSGASAQAIASNVSAAGVWDFKSDVNVSGALTLTQNLTVGTINATLINATTVSATALQAATGTFSGIVSAEGNLVAKGNVLLGANKVIVSSDTGNITMQENTQIKFGGTGTLIVGSIASGLNFNTNSGATALLVDQHSNVVIGRQALAIAATNGFLYIPSMPGNPTGTPTDQNGLVPMVYNTSANKIAIYYNGSWRQTASLT